MDAPEPRKPVPIKRFLPYWAVFQADVRQTIRSWVYRTWVLLSVMIAVGFLLYRLGLYREAGMLQPTNLIGDLLRWSMLGSVTLIIMMTAGAISSDRGTVADSILCRGISRYQYFMAKWHARLVTVLGTFLVLGSLLLVSSAILLQQDLSLVGSAVALLTVTVMLAAVITCGVTFSSITNSTIMGITVLWLFIYGVGFTLSLLPSRFPSPEQALNRLPHMLRGYYDLHYLGQLTLWSAGISLFVALIGIGYFARRDV
jgi:hypothetical protein